MTYDIGRLAVCGTVNDLAVMGARPLGLSLALIIEEGLPLTRLYAVVDSIAATAAEWALPSAASSSDTLQT